MLWEKTHLAVGRDQTFFVRLASACCALLKHICNLQLCWSHSKLKITVPFVILCFWFRVLSLLKHPLLLQEQPKLNVQFQQFFLFSVQFLVRQVGMISSFSYSDFRRLSIYLSISAQGWSYKIKIFLKLCLK